MSFQDPRDINRDLGYRDPARDDLAGPPAESSGYALPIALFAVVFIIGALIMFAPTSTQQTASNAPSVTTTTPTPTPAPVAPPATKAPASPQQ